MRPSGSTRKMAKSLMSSRFRWNRSSSSLSGMARPRSLPGEALLPSKVIHLVQHGLRVPVRRALPDRGASGARLDARPAFTLQQGRDAGAHFIPDLAHPLYRLALGVLE